MLTQLRLYLALGALIAFLGLAGAALWYRGQAISAAAEAAQAKANLETAINVNKANQETIGRMKAQAEANDRLTAELAQKLADANSALIETSASRNRLKNEDATVREYLDTPVPESLRRMYH